MISDIMEKFTRKFIHFRMSADCWSSNRIKRPNIIRDGIFLIELNILESIIIKSRDNGKQITSTIINNGQSIKIRMG
jgi:hypothetical protein